jgi:tetratricopeptide (TPR) repeat protein
MAGRFGSGFTGGIRTFWSCNKAGAIPHFSQHLSSNPRHFNSLLFRGISYSIINQSANAVADLQQAERVGSGSEKLVARSQLSFLQGKEAEGVKALKEATDKYPNDGIGWFWYGMMLSDHKQGQDALRRAIDLNYSEAPECHFQLGRQHAAAGDHQKAITAYRTSLEGNPYRTVCHISLGFSLLETGQTQDAKECFLKAVDLNPALTEANLGLAKVYNKEGDQMQAKKHSDIWTQSQKSPDEPTYQVSGSSEHSGSVDRASDALDALTDGTLAKHGQSTVLQTYRFDPFRQSFENDPLKPDSNERNSFIASTFLKTTPLSEMKLYRRYGGGAAKEGQWWTIEPSMGRTDLAVRKDWNDFSKVAEITVPSGIYLLEGLCREQPGSPFSHTKESLQRLEKAKAVAPSDKKPLFEPIFDLTDVPVGGGWQVLIPRPVVQLLIKASEAKSQREKDAHIREAKQVQEQCLQDMINS